MQLFKVLVMATLVLSLAACGQNSQEPQSAGPPGPPGPQGPPGPPGAASAERLRIIRGSCAPGACTVQCKDDEFVVSAWCGARRNEATFPTETSASCRPLAANNPLVALCAKSATP